MPCCGGWERAPSLLQPVELPVQAVLEGLEVSLKSSLNSGWHFPPTTRYAAGFPNGRRLPDDVALLTCQTGDCLLVETSYMASEAWPRETTNDKAFLDEFPYLAEPWPAQEPADRGIPWGVVLALLLLLVVLVFIALAVIGLVCVIRKRKARKRSRRAAPAAG